MLPASAPDNVRNSRARASGRDGWNALLRQPLGGVHAIGIAVALLCFAAPRLTEAIDDFYGYGADWRGLAQRTSPSIAGFFYIEFGILGASIVLSGEFARNEDAGVRDWTAWALSMSAGQWLVGIAGLTVTCVGIDLAIAGIRRRFATRLGKSGEGSGLAILLGTNGLIARSPVFILIGCFLIFAAWHTNAHEATGFGGALLTLRSERYGNLLLLIAAAGLLEFGLFGVSEARFGRTATPAASAVRAKMNKMNGNSKSRLREQTLAPRRAALPRCARRQRWRRRRRWRA